MLITVSSLKKGKNSKGSINVEENNFLPPVEA